MNGTNDRTLLDGALADPPLAVKEADMAEAPARISTEIDDRAPAPKPAASRLGMAVVVAAVLFAGALLASRSDWGSQAEIRARPVGFADVVDKVKPAVISVRKISGYTQ